MILTAICVSGFSLLSVAALAADNNYQFDEIAQLNHAQSESADWLQLLTIPNNGQQYFVINKRGQMFLVDDGLKQPHPVLELSDNQSQEPLFIQLTAIELHPNFTLRDQLGYGTFYTAHLETFDKKTTSKRLQERNGELTLKFDAVITEWQFNSVNYQKVDLNTKREILRIAVPEDSVTIKQMSFNPYTQSWDDGFGLLYIALNGQEKWQKPLYSGVVLRINPAKFGFRNFTVPLNNPYIKDSQIKDEIYLLGGHHIRQFIWPDKNSDNILLAHRYKNKFLLSLTDGHNDWREHPPKKIFYQGDTAITDMLAYRGRNLPHLRNKLLLLNQNNQRWFVGSLAAKLSVNQSRPVDHEPQPEWLFSPQQLNTDNEITFSADSNGEVLLLDKTAGVIFQISPKNTAANKPISRNITTEVQTESINRSYIIFIVLIIALLYWLKSNKFSAKAVVRKQFAHIELSESKQQIGLYHRHQSTTETIIDIANIICCEVALNEQVVNTVNQQAEQGFNHQKEQFLRDTFAKEQVNKMIDGKVRQVSLSITDTHKKSFTVCLYMRKGSDRITKKSYTLVIDELIDWCWLIAEKINAGATEQRKKKPIITITSADVAKKNQNKMPLHSQAAAIRPATHAVEKSSLSSAAPLAKEQPSEKETNQRGDVNNRNHNSTTVDTELVNALEKLVNLKQQGFLTQEEFTKAKEKLLQNLFDQ
ncbi:MAG: SHOCT domain-containing protein [Colwellia sp.]|nr:SHOCT domain-containing protein [Colwellia sp.]